MTDSSNGNDLCSVIAEIERRGLAWAVCLDKNGSYAAVVQRNSRFIGDALLGPYAVGGKTPYEALKAALSSNENMTLSQ